MGLLLLILAIILMLLGVVTYFGHGPLVALMKRRDRWY